MSSDSRHLVEVVIGPCSREECERVTLFIQEALDDRFPALGAAAASFFELLEEDAPSLPVRSNKETT